MRIAKLINNTQALQVVLEATVIAHTVIKRLLSRVTKRGMPKIVRQGNRFYDVFVETKRPTNTPVLFAQPRYCASSVRETGHPRDLRKPEFCIQADEKRSNE